MNSDNTSGADSRFEVVWPLGGKSTRDIQPVPRLDTLEGKTICEMSNMLFKADILYSELETLLSKRYPGVKFVSHENFGCTHGGHEEDTIAALPEKLAQFNCDAAISAVGG